MIGRRHHGETRLGQEMGPEVDRREGKAGRELGERRQGTGIAARLATAELGVLLRRHLRHRHEGPANRRQQHQKSGHQPPMPEAGPLPRHGRGSRHRPSAAEHRQGLERRRDPDLPCGSGETDRHQGYDQRPAGSRQPLRGDESHDRPNSSPQQRSDDERERTGPLADRFEQGLGFGHMVEPEGLQQWVDAVVRPMQAVRKRHRQQHGHHDAGCGQDRPTPGRTAAEARRESQRHEPRGPERHRREMQDREGVDADDAVAGRRHGRDEEPRDRHRKPEGEPQQGRLHPFARDRPGDRGRGQDRDHERQVLEADRQRDGDAETGEGGGPRLDRIEARQGGGRHQGQEQDLRRVVVDAARDELAVADPAQHDQQGRRNGCRRSRQDTGRHCHGGDEAGLERDGKGDASRAFREIRRQHESEAPDQDRQGNVDHARPVHEEAVGRVQAGGRKIEPALPGHPVAQLHGPHGVVRIEEGPGLPGRHRPWPGHSEGDREGDQQGKKDGVDRAARRVVGGVRRERQAGAHRARPYGSGGTL